MAYEKFALNFTLIDQIVYEILTAAAPLTPFCGSNITLWVITDEPILHISFHYNFLKT